MVVCYNTRSIFKASTGTHLYRCGVTTRTADGAHGHGLLQVWTRDRKAFYALEVMYFMQCPRAWSNRILYFQAGMLQRALNIDPSHRRWAMKIANNKRARFKLSLLAIISSGGRSSKTFSAEIA